MKRVKVWLFPFFLILACISLHYMQHSIVNLTMPYLPNNEIVSLLILAPTLLVSTFLTTFICLKQSKTKRPIARSLVSVAVMLLLILIAALIFLSYAARRYAGYLPVPVLPDLPLGMTTMTIAALGIIHLSALLICRLVKNKSAFAHAFLSVVGWVLLNGCLYFLTI